MKFKLIFIFVFFCINLSLTFKTPGRIKVENRDSIYYHELVYKKPNCLLAINDSNGVVTILSKQIYVMILSSEFEDKKLDNVDSIVFSDLLRKKHRTQNGMWKWRVINTVDKYKDSIYLGIADRKIMKTCIYNGHQLKDEYLSDDRKLYYIIYKLIKMRKFVSYTPSIKSFYLYD